MGADCIWFSVWQVQQCSISCYDFDRNPDMLCRIGGEAYFIKMEKEQLEILSNNAKM